MGKLACRCACSVNSSVFISAVLCIVELAEFVKIVGESGKMGMEMKRSGV